MRTRELLLQCKIKLKIESDYALAKELDINTGRISDYMSGKRIPSVYTLVKIAELLDLDALGLIAEFEELKAKNAQERSFWTVFRARAKQPLRGLIMALLCIVTLWTGSGQANNAEGVFRRLKHA